MDNQLTKVKWGIKKRNLHKNTIKLNRQYNNKIIQSGGLVVSEIIIICIVVIGLLYFGRRMWKALESDKYNAGGGGSRQRGGGYLMNVNLMRTNEMFYDLCEKLNFTINKDFKELFKEIFHHLQIKYPRLTSLIIKEMKAEKVFGHDEEDDEEEDGEEIDVRSMILGEEAKEADEADGEKARHRKLYEMELEYLTKIGQGNQTVAMIHTLLVDANTQLRKQISLYLSLVRLFADIKDNFVLLEYGFYKKPPTGRKVSSMFSGSKERERLFLFLKNKTTGAEEIRYYKYSEYNKYMYVKGRFNIRSIVVNSGESSGESITIKTDDSVEIILNKIPNSTFGKVVLTDIKLNHDVVADEGDTVNSLNFNDWFDLLKFRNFGEPTKDMDKMINILMIEINKLLCVKTIAQHDFILKVNTTVPEEEVDKSLVRTNEVMSVVSEQIQSKAADIHNSEARDVGTSGVETSDFVEVPLKGDKPHNSRGNIFSRAKKFLGVRQGLGGSERILNEIDKLKKFEADGYFTEQEEVRLGELRRQLYMNNILKKRTAPERRDTQGGTRRRKRKSRKHKSRKHKSRKHHYKKHKSRRH